MNIPRTGDVVLINTGDGVFKRQMPHNSIPKVMKAVDYELVLTGYGTSLALSNEKPDAHNTETERHLKPVRESKGC